MLYRAFSNTTDDGLKLSGKNIAENLCESTRTHSIPLYLGWNVDKYISKMHDMRRRYIPQDDNIN